MLLFKKLGWPVRLQRVDVGRATRLSARDFDPNPFAENVETQCARWSVIAHCDGAAGS
jgi:hypothetical protein